jgi:hypothetical protein
MSFFDLFMVVAGNYPADQFFQTVFTTDTDGNIGVGIILTIGPRNDHSQLKQYTIADKEAFATAVQEKVAAGSELLAAFEATLPTPDAAVTQGPVVTPPPTPAPVVEASVVTPGPTNTGDTPPANETQISAETTPDTPTSDTTTTEAPAAETSTDKAAIDTTETAPQDQS